MRSFLMYAFVGGMSSLSTVLGTYLLKDYQESKEDPGVIECELVLAQSVLSLKLVPPMDEIITFCFALKDAAPLVPPTKEIPARDRVVPPTPEEI